MAAYDQIIKLLSECSKGELEQIRKRCGALASIGPKHRVETQNVKDDWLLSGILEELKNRGLGSSLPSDFQIRNRQSFASYYKRSEKVREVFEEKVQLRNGDKLALGRICARCLARKVDEFAPISLDSMLRNINLVLEGFENSFPGYISSGVMPDFIEALHRGLKE